MADGLKQERKAERKRNAGRKEEGARRGGERGGGRCCWYCDHAGETRFLLRSAGRDAVTSTIGTRNAKGANHCNPARDPPERTLGPMRHQHQHQHLMDALALPILHHPRAFTLWVTPGADP